MFGAKKQINQDCSHFHPITNWYMNFIDFYNTTTTHYYPNIRYMLELLPQGTKTPQKLGTKSATKLMTNFIGMHIVLR